MEQILNSHTNTLHKPRRDDHWHRTQCGALTHVDDRHVTTVSDERSGDESVSRCGRCFEGSGGY